MNNVNLTSLHKIMNPQEFAHAKYEVYLYSRYTDSEERQTFLTKEAAILFAQEQASEDTLASVWLEDTLVYQEGGTYD